VKNQRNKKMVLGTMNKIDKALSTLTRE
jgi:hypothetical protein